MGHGHKSHGRLTGFPSWYGGGVGGQVAGPQQPWGWQDVGELGMYFGGGIVVVHRGAGGLFLLFRTR